MRKSEMTDEQKIKWNKIYSLLNKNDWNLTDYGRLFEQEAFLRNEISMYSIGKHMEIEIEYSFELDKLIVYLNSLKEEGEFSFFMYLGEDYFLVFNQIVKWVPIISEKNFQKQIKKLLSTCHEIYVNVKGEIYKLEEK